MSIPMPWYQDPAVIQASLSVKRIAVVGLSSSRSRPSYGVSAYVQRCGYDVVPINPNESEILGVQCYPSLAALPEPVEMVNVFRAPAAVPQIVEEAARCGARYLWLQLGVVHHEAAEHARDLGLSVIMDKCLAVELRHHH